MKRGAVALLGLLVGCGGKGPSSTPATGEGGSPRSDASSVAPSPLLVDPCPGGPDPPDTLECTGLYTNIATKQVAAAARSYAPAVPLWSDAADKTRWVYLPPGQKIDTSSPSEWVFPVGTKFWKEFSREGKRIETRLFEKIQRNFWRYTTYAWNADESATQRSAGGDLVLPSGAPYHIPTSSECDDCHKGRSDRILGFEQGLLGLSGAKGLTLEQLVADGRLSPAPAQVHLQVGDDGTGVAAPALAWLHVNCGVTCHNTNTNAFAYPAGMNLRLDPALLDGSSLASSNSILTTVGIRAKTPSWNGAIRIVPGDPANSLLVSLISHRGKGVQMPPIATLVVDDADVANVVAWVSQMPVQPGLVVDAGSDMDAFDAGPPDMPAAEASLGDDASDGSVSPPGDDGGVDAVQDDAVATGTADSSVDATLDDGGVAAPDAGSEGAVADGGVPDQQDAGAEADLGEAGSVDAADDGTAPDALE
ncbi:MAG: hypothetical protein M3O36_03420 [Myxococcota bacterium]|nr:hypothetical protein [Myxococcota bacterium]